MVVQQPIFKYSNTDNIELLPGTDWVSQCHIEPDWRWRWCVRSYGVVTDDDWLTDISHITLACSALYLLTVS